MEAKTADWHVILSENVSDFYLVLRFAKLDEQVKLYPGGVFVMCVKGGAAGLFAAQTIHVHTYSWACPNNLLIFKQLSSTIYWAGYIPGNAWLCMSWIADLFMHITVQPHNLVT